ncbi:MAG: hypothetical protein H0V62_10800 [Gammaproteobacteria bacterium]|nr:hypothetical protein [Gammaproteobacteria bacterium]
METNKLTVRLPASEIRFIKDFAKRHGITVTEVIRRYFTRLQAPQLSAIHPEIAKLTGNIPSKIDAIAEHQGHLYDKHR